MIIQIQPSNRIFYLIAQLLIGLGAAFGQLGCSYGIKAPNQQMIQNADIEPLGDDWRTTVWLWAADRTGYVFSESDLIIADPVKDWFGALSQIEESAYREGWYAWKIQARPHPRVALYENNSFQMYGSRIQYKSAYEYPELPSESAFGHLGLWRSATSSDYPWTIWMLGDFVVAESLRDEDHSWRSNYYLVEEHLKSKFGDANSRTKFSTDSVDEVELSRLRNQAEERIAAVREDIDFVQSGLDSIIFDGPYGVQFSMVSGNLTRDRIRRSIDSLVSVLAEDARGKGNSAGANGMDISSVELIDSAKVIKAAAREIRRSQQSAVKSSSRNQEIDTYFSSNPDRAFLKDLIRNWPYSISPEMTQREVTLSWGDPKTKRKSYYLGNTSETWDYTDKRTLIIFQDDKIILIQEY